jgi:hypothetical protein
VGEEVRRLRQMLREKRVQENRNGSQQKGHQAAQLSPFTLHVVMFGVTAVTWSP